MNAQVAYLPTAFAAGTHVAYLGPDLDVVLLWHGHPGFVVASGTQPTTGPAVPLVAFACGRVIELDPSKLMLIDSETYYRRFERLMQGLHPLADHAVKTYPSDVQARWIGGA